MGGGSWSGHVSWPTSLGRWTRSLPNTPNWVSSPTIRSHSCRATGPSSGGHSRIREGFVSLDVGAGLCWLEVISFRPEGLVFRSCTRRYRPEYAQGERKTVRRGYCFRRLAAHSRRTDCVEFRPHRPGQRPNARYEPSKTKLSRERNPRKGPNDNPNTEGRYMRAAAPRKMIYAGNILPTACLCPDLVYHCLTCADWCQPD